MKVSELMVRDVIQVSPDDTISKALSLMIENSVHQLPVTDDKKYKGMIFAKQFIDANVPPETTKVSTFVVNTSSLSPSTDVVDACREIVNTGLRALPVIYKGKLEGIISETDLVLNSDLGRITVDEVMKGAIVIPSDSTLGNALSKMKKHNISRLPVIDKNGKLISSMDTLDIVKVLRVPRERKSGSRTTRIASGELKKDVRDVKVGEIAHNASPVSPGSRLANAVKNLEKAEEIIITSNDRAMGIVAPKDILLRILPERSGPMIHVSQVEDESVKNEIVMEVSKFLKRMKGRYDRIYAVEVAVEQHNNRKYSMKGKLVTTEGLTTARSVAWDPRGAARELMNRLDRRSGNNRENRRGPSKAR